MSAQINMAAARQGSRPVIVARTPKMSAQINMAASKGSAVSTIPGESAADIDKQAAPLNPVVSTILEAEEAAIAALPLPSELVAVQAILEVDKPQSLRQIFASLCYLLAYNTDPQDYYFIVDPVDRPNLAGRGIKKFEQLINTSTNSAIQLHFITKTGMMTVMTMAPSLYRSLNGEVYSLVSKNIAGVPGLERWYPIELLGEPQYVCAIKYSNKPYGVFLLANPGNNKKVNDKVVRSLLPDITRDYPSIKMVVQLQLRGLDSNIHKDNKDIEDRVRHISQQSCIEVWAHNGVKFNKCHASSAKNLPEDGELRLALLSENTEDKTVPILQFSDILQIVRGHCEQGVPLLRHPDNKDPRAPNNNKGLRASVFPLDALKSGFAAGIAQLLGPHAQEHKAGGVGFQARGGVGSKAPFSSLSGGAALATRRSMLPPTGKAGLGPIKAGGSRRHIHGTARNTLTSLLSARHLVGRLLRR
ncbi:hypothetical protein B0T21DRAFT_368929 [Apiosordaria backusii]|uniref:Uncharacterized protein n=1 Tax=Apiosordaria backusii TaxID=314023 RepID=A0AA40BDY5_9PEZI|nr:hypothetical protein B0T21DRAFT_368929 [Apiosordaria backusii]